MSRWLEDVLKQISHFAGDCSAFMCWWGQEVARRRRYVTYCVLDIEQACAHSWQSRYNYLFRFDTGVSSLNWKKNTAQPSSPYVRFSQQEGADRENIERNTFKLKSKSNKVRKCQITFNTVLTIGHIVFFNPLSFLCIYVMWLKMALSGISTSKSTTTFWSVSKYSLSGTNHCCSPDATWLRKKEKLTGML